MTAVAPLAPGRLGVAATVEELRTYLEELGRWREERKAELDRLDQAALDAAESDSYTADITLSMALWQAVADRHDQILAAWDSGRVTTEDRERISQLVWGRLEARAGVGMAVSVVEACRLSDALAVQLRARLDLDPLGLDVAARMRTLRAQVERIRDLVTDPPDPAGLPPDAAATLDHLDHRLVELSARARRGADVTGGLRGLETDAVLAERDLIVALARHRDAGRDAARAATLRTELTARASTLRELVDRCVAAVPPVPRFAVPDVTALGPVHTAPGDVVTYLARLSAVERALGVAETAYSAALAHHRELRGLLDGYRAMAAATGRDADPAVAAACRAAREALRATPCDLDATARLVSRYQSLVRTPAAPAPAPSPPGTAPAPSPPGTAPAPTPPIPPPGRTA